jgi:hypothetical protein
VGDDNTEVGGVFSITTTKLKRVEDSKKHPLFQISLRLLPTIYNN